ncbi:ABC transporter ATP-binding protein [Puia dinghuensis]|uniref:Putative multidrug export ATP-binding/permease protein YgaD n=1 Tax=Puia dinghuensis TaxID=1792502 RepID=A0A8J2UBD7_9BACT|nr:ABC transporter ATP-binding protein [Puia dinghuensis]GGA93534.1 putative multidrug export ATP-binding/permease protein YgaD [Puia dinghuensis]
MNVQKRSNWKTARRFLKYLRPYIKQEALFLLVIILGTIAPVLTPFFLKLIVDKIVPAHDLKMLTIILSLWSVVIVVQSLAASGTEYLREWLSAHIGYDMRRDIFLHVIKLPINYFKEKKFGDILHRVNNEVDDIKGIFTGEFVRLLQSSLLLAGITTMILIISLRLFLIVLCLSPCFIFLYLYFNPRNEVQSEDALRAESDLLHYLTDRLKKIALIKIFNGHVAERSAIETKGGILTKKRLIRARTSSTFTGISNFLLLLGPIMILWLGGKSVMSGAMTIGSVIASFQYLNRIFFPLVNLIESQMDLTKAVVSMRRVIEVLDTPAEGRSSHYLENGKRLDGPIEFKNVRFAYGNKLIFEDLNLRLEPGRKYALIGPSGAGKSTLLDLVFRFSSPQSGHIRAGGTDIEEIDLECWRKQIVLVTQERQLLDESIEQNIMYGGISRRDEPNGPSDVISWDLALPILSNDLKENLGKNSQRVSGGEAQRIALARAVFKNADIILLDEATSAIDLISEARILSHLLKIWKDKTVVLVSHSLTTVKFMDELICLDKGKIIETGTYQRSMEVKGQVWKLMGDQVK